MPKHRYGEKDSRETALIVGSPTYWLIKTGFMFEAHGISPTETNAQTIPSFQEGTIPGVTIIQPIFRNLKMAGHFSGTKTNICGRGHFFRTRREPGARRNKIQQVSDELLADLF